MSMHLTDCVGEGVSPAARASAGAGVPPQPSEEGGVDVPVIPASVVTVGALVVTLSSMTPRPSAALELESEIVSESEE